MKLIAFAFFFASFFHLNAQIEKRAGIFTIKIDSLDFKLFIVKQDDSSLHFWSFWKSYRLSSGTFHLVDNNRDSFYFASSGNYNLFNSTCVIKGRFFTDSLWINYFNPICFSDKIKQTQITLIKEKTKISNLELISKLDKDSQVYKVKSDDILLGHETNTSSNSIGMKIKAGQLIISTFTDHHGKALIYFINDLGNYIFGWLDSKNLEPIK